MEYQQSNEVSLFVLGLSLNMVLATLRPFVLEGQHRGSFVDRSAFAVPNRHS